MNFKKKRERVKTVKTYEILKLKQEICVMEEFPPLNITSSYAIACWLQEQIGYDSQENLVLLCLDTKNHVNSYSIVHKGTLNQSVCHPRDIFQRALLSNASRIVLSHNHPSNDSTPSFADNNVTERISKCGELLGIELLDHIIVGQTTYFSYREEHLL